MKTFTKEMQANLSPREAQQIFIDGNNRFVQNLKAHRDYKNQIVETSHGQYPFGVVLSCIDSRVPIEIIFDLGIGDVFNVKVAGSVINPDVLGSMEYSCKVAGSKIIVVLGHTSCGAVTAACKNVKLGNITTLLDKIKPAIINSQKNPDFILDAKDKNSVNHVAKEGIHVSIDRIRKESPILAEMEKNGEIKIVGAMYDIQTGEVEFFPW